MQNYFCLYTALERHTGTGTVKELSGMGYNISMNSVDFIYKITNSYISYLSPCIIAIRS